MFASGCFDKILRIWNIKLRKVVDWSETPEYITALGFTPDTGASLVVGLVNGDVLIYESNAEKLKLTKHVNTRSSRITAFSKGGRKVTGIDFLN